MTTPTRTEIRAGLKRLTGLSPAVQAILPRLGDENLPAQELGQMVNQDPILAARVLHLANSPFYGLPRQVGSLEEAVLILGISHLRGMVLATGLISLFADSEALASSQATAAAAGSLAKSLRQDQGMAYSAGLLHNLGALLLGHFAPEIWQSLASAPASESVDRLSRERLAYGFDHCELGADIAGDWHFPDVIQSAIRSHLKPPNEPTEALTDLVHVAWTISGQVASGELSTINPTIMQRMGLDCEAGEVSLEKARQAAIDSQAALAAL
ncbi:MAG: HDOD domain-containing protein [Thiobacillus sp.]|nr:HDOD domain-containing protein [Thiobacillus sp.]